MIGLTVRAVCGVMSLVRAIAAACIRIERLMRAQALRARPQRRARPIDTGKRDIGAPAPNILDRQFTASSMNQKWVADFTFLWTAEGWLFVAVVLDLFSRRVIGWSMQPTGTIRGQILHGANDDRRRPNA